MYILSGSSTPEFDANYHSGAGRFSKLTLRTLSLQEMGLNSKKIEI
jgi:hypothetical protein